MCFVSLVSMNVPRPSRARPAVVRRSGFGARSRGAHWLRASWLRVFALLILLLGWVAQQRVLTAAVRPTTSGARLVAERVQSIETHAVRAEAPLRVAPAPLFARLPPFYEPLVARPDARAQVYRLPPSANPACP